jgi:hypothetical protein
VNDLFARSSVWPSLEDLSGVPRQRSSLTSLLARFVRIALTAHLEEVPGARLESGLVAEPGEREGRRDRRRAVPGSRLTSRQAGVWDPELASAAPGRGARRWG